MMYCRTVIVLILFATTNLYAANRNIHPNWAPRTWALKSDNITTIMGYRAELTGNLNHVDRSRARLVNNAAVRGFKDANDMMTWEVEAAYEAEYAIALLYNGSKELLSQCTLEVTSASSTIKEKPHLARWEGRPNYQRHHLKKSLLLKKGKNKISFRLVDYPESQAVPERSKDGTNNPDVKRTFRNSNKTSLVSP